MAYAVITETRLSKERVHYLAQSLAEALGFRPDSDVREIVRLMGGEVVIEDTLLTDPEQTQSLIVTEPEAFRIIVPSHTSPERDRFTVAHELGHYVLHYLWHRKKAPDYPAQVVAYRQGARRVEWEANWFAAGFLMPEVPFRAVFAEQGGDLRKLALRFRVSISAARVRAKELRLGSA